MSDAMVLVVVMWGLGVVLGYEVRRFVSGRDKKDSTQEGEG